MPAVTRIIRHTRGQGGRGGARASDGSQAAGVSRTYGWRARVRHSRRSRVRTRPRRFHRVFNALSVQGAQRETGGIHACWLWWHVPKLDDLRGAAAGRPCDCKGSRRARRPRRCGDHSQAGRFAPLAQAIKNVIAAAVIGALPGGAQPEAGLVSDERPNSARRVRVRAEARPWAGVPVTSDGGMGLAHRYGPQNDMYAENTPTYSHGGMSMPNHGVDSAREKLQKVSGVAGEEASAE